MPTREELINAFLVAQQQIDDDPRLSVATLRLRADTRLYLKGFEAIGLVALRDAPDIEVMEDTTFHCAQKLLENYQRVAVLNFANAYTPGGGVTRGARAQEECLCRSSNLYRALTLPYLLENYYQWNKQTTGDMGTDALIWSPGVMVFRSDDMLPQPLEEWFRVDVLTCAAPYYDAHREHPVTLEKLEQVFCDRIRNILEVAASQGVQALVLGAFGCGAFHNPRDLVAGVFRRLLVDKGYGRYFEKVVFAIKHSDGANPNLEAFQRILGK